MICFKNISIFFAAGLTACGAAVPVAETAAVAQVTAPVTPTAKVVKPKADSPALTHQQKEWQPFQIKSVTLDAETYMLADLTPQYATLYLSCSHTPTLSISVVTRSAPQRTTTDGTLISETGEIVGLHFWQRYRVFFDEAPVSFPPKYQTITKQVAVGGAFETRSERKLLRTYSSVYDILLPKLKAAKVMRLVNHDGIGPSFDLTTIKTDIEILETKCAPKDAK